MGGENIYTLSTAAAEGYERQKVPSVFAPLAEATLDAIELPEGGRVLDVACGTGIVARLVAARMRGAGRVAGADLNPAMLAVAERAMPGTAHSVAWVACDVSTMPLGTGSFDLVICQQGLQFFPDKPAALAEMRRVLAPGGRLVLTCWARISPLFQAVSDALAAAGDNASAAKAVEPFAFRDGAVIRRLIEGAGFRVLRHTTLEVHRRLASPAADVRAEILASPYEPALRSQGDAFISSVVARVIAVLHGHREGEALVIPQDSHLFEAAA